MWGQKKRLHYMCNPFSVCGGVWRSCYLGIKTNEQSRASHRLSIVLRLALRLPLSIRAMLERATPLFSLRATCDISLLVLACLSALHRRIRTCAVFSNISFNSILLFGLSFINISLLLQFLLHRYSRRCLCALRCTIRRPLLQ